MRKKTRVDVVICCPNHLSRTQLLSGKRPYLMAGAFIVASPLSTVRDSSVEPSQPGVPGGVS